MVNLSALAVTLYSQGMNPDGFGLELSKALLQVGVVSVGGAILSLASYEYQRERANRERQQELDRKAVEYRDGLVKGVLARVITTYNRAKKARRLMRARAHIVGATGDLIIRDQWDVYIELINDAQLDLERIREDVSTNESAFRQPKVLAKNLRAMEQYLSRLISEYEQHRCRDEPAMHLDVLNHLKAFLGRATEGFEEEFASPCENTRITLREQISHQQLPVRHDQLTVAEPSFVQ